MRLKEGLGVSQVVRLILVAAIMVWGCASVVAPLVSIADETTDVKKPESAPEESPNEADKTSSARETKKETESPKAEDADSERESSGEEIEPKAEGEKKVEKQIDQEEEAIQTDKQPEKQPDKKKHIIGATARILEKDSGFVFRARVDTGAKSCSLHVEEMTIENEVEGEDQMEVFQKNVGKVVKFKVRNGSDKTRLLECRIKKYVLIKTSGHVERRYKVPLKLSWNGGAVEKTVLVTLNDRGGMDYPLLLGRNFLSGQFLVDVDIDSDD